MRKGLLMFCISAIVFAGITIFMTSQNKSKPLEISLNKEFQLKKGETATFGDIKISFLGYGTRPGDEDTPQVTMRINVSQKEFWENSTYRSADAEFYDAHNTFDFDEYRLTAFEGPMLNTVTLYLERLSEEERIKRNKLRYPLL